MPIYGFSLKLLSYPKSISINLNEIALRNTEFIFKYSVCMVKTHLGHNLNTYSVEFLRSAARVVLYFILKYVMAFYSIYYRNYGTK